MVRAWQMEPWQQQQQRQGVAAGSHRKAVAVILEVDDEGILRVMLDETCRVMRVRPSNAQPVVVVDP